MLGEDFVDDPFDKDDSESENASGQSDTLTTKADNKENSLSERERLLQQGFDMSKSFANKSVWSRIAIIVAGPFFNFLLAFILALVVVGQIGYDPCTVDRLNENSPAAQAGLQEGDQIIRVNGQKITFAREYSFYKYYHGDKAMDITYLRDGQKYTTTLTPEYKKTQGYKLGITITTECVVNSVSEDSPAAQAGMKSNDIIQMVDGTRLTDGNVLSELLEQTKDRTVEIVVRRNGEDVTLQVTPKLVETESYYTGFASYGARVRTNAAQTVQYAFHEVGYVISTVIKSLGMMFTGQVGVNDLMGPVGTVSAISNVMEESKVDGTFYVILNLLNFSLMISANLGVMNLLPLPALDGGRLLFLLIEAVRGKPVKKEHEGMVHFIGMVLLMILMVYVLFKDIKGLF